MLDEAFGACVCGSGWFSLEAPDVTDEDLEEHVQTPAVCISTDGEITGYAGKLVCTSCETDWNPLVRFKPTRSHLRVVE